MAKPLPDLEFLRECMDYSPDTGVIIWRQRPRKHFSSEQACGAWNTKYAGRTVGNINGDGYYVATLSGRRIVVHRVCFALGVGALPDDDAIVDHRDGNPQNNRLSNLRTATRQQNMWNSRSQRRKADGLPKGISFYAPTSSYVARFAIGRRRVHVGYFQTILEAVAAIDAKRRELHGEFARS